MMNSIELVKVWEIQLLVLISSGIQIFLFFTGGLRRRSTNMFLTFFIWIAYWGADFVAVYALGYLSRHEDVTFGSDRSRGINPSLAFFWAPFLLVHLGGQDTITGFAMEDNNLWLRHLLNLVVQVVLAFYVFWNSILRHGAQLLFSGIFLFITGVIKYGERTWSLKRGSFKCLESSTATDYRNRLRQEVIYEDNDDLKIGNVYTAMHSMPQVFRMFAGHHLPRTSCNSLFSLLEKSLPNQKLERGRKILEMQLGMMYDDIYTKALVLRRRCGILLRCISLTSWLVAFMLFLSANKQSYSSVDIAITYILFIFGGLLDVLSMFIFLMSPWTWAWLAARKNRMVGSLSWRLLTSAWVGWLRERPLMSNSMGQFDLMNLSEGSDQPWTCDWQLLRAIGINLAKFVGAEVWMTKILDTEYVMADKILECLLDGVIRFKGSHSNPLQVLPELHHTHGLFGIDFGIDVMVMHFITEMHLSKYPYVDVEDKAATERMDGLVKTCRILSRYMVYLLVNKPYLLPLNIGAGRRLEDWKSNSSNIKTRLEKKFDIVPGENILDWIKEAWIRLIIYAAAKSRPEMHAQLLASGGEPLTFVWLMLTHGGIGDLGHHRVRLSNRQSGVLINCAFHFSNST